MKKAKSRKAKPSKVVYTYYSVVFEDGTETTVTGKCKPKSRPTTLREFKGTKGSELESNHYSLVEVKGKVYTFNGNTPLTQPEALTKEQLVKLYEEYHATKWDEYNNRLNQWLKDKHFKLVSILLGNQTLLFTRGFIEKSIRESENNEPKWIEPTFNEFMESLKEGEYVTVCRFSELCQN